MKRIPKTELSFNDLSFRIPGIAFTFLGIGMEFLAGADAPKINITESISFPAYFALSVIGLVMFASPYIVMAWDIYKTKK